MVQSNASEFDKLGQTFLKNLTDQVMHSGYRSWHAVPLVGVHVSLKYVGKVSPRVVLLFPLPFCEAERSSLQLVVECE